ncbi:flagellar hook-basal body protein [Anaerosporobacter faecicola]|uniref:flagellar hook-basal body protein n=1 Tax=Anaerosporobacter faecicola TaxID=2718714 RepID=UPI001439D31E|nr:flagellar hook-basal body protein [Anaerosporobacter faecicola]
MVRGLYTAYTGMINEQKRLDTISNNLANAATIGYKKENVTSQAFEEALTIKINDGSEAYANRPIGTMSLGVRLGEYYTDYTQGSFRETGNTYDLAIEGDGFFTVSVTDKYGNEHIKYTRDGSFKMTQDGYVVDAYGNHLQGDGGDIQIPTDAQEVTIGVDGSIYADRQYVGKVTITDFEDYNFLEKSGDNYYSPVDGAITKESTSIIRQGYTEQSNVNVISEMVSLINITRAYEAGQKVIKTQDQLLDQTVNQVGKV